MKKQDPQKTKKTPAELEEERKRRAAEWWNKVIVYYLNRMYHAEVDAEVEKYRPKLLVEQLAEYYHEHQAMKLLKQKEPGRLSALEILRKMQDYQEEDSPFRDLYKEIQENPEAEEKIERSLGRCVEEAPKRILGRGRRNAVHVRAKPRPEGEKAPEEQQDPEEAKREEERLRYEMAFLRTVMPPQLYRKLCEGLVQQGRMKDPEQDFPGIPEEEPGRTYEEFVALHQAVPREREGELDNMDELCTSAAYMLAAYEQKDSPVFDEKQADARAMEISGSRAFRAYVKDHPGSLLAAAQNTGLEATQAGVAALDRELRKRDGVLADVRDGLRAKATGQTGPYHRMLNSLDRFLKTPGEPSKKEKDALAMSLAQYVMTDGAPGAPGYRPEAALQASRALEALLPEKDYQKFLETANAKRSPEEAITPARLKALAEKAPEAAPEREGPVLVRPEAEHPL